MQIVEIENAKNELLEDAQVLTKKLADYENTNKALEEENQRLNDNIYEVK